MSSAEMFKRSAMGQMTNHSNSTPVPLHMYDHNLANQQANDRSNQRPGSSNPNSSTMSISSTSTEMSMHNPMLVRPTPISFHGNNQSINQANEDAMSYFSANQPQRMFMQPLPLQSPRSINHSLHMNQHQNGSLPMRVTPSPYFKSIENQRMPRAQHDHNVVYSQLIASNPQFSDLSSVQRHDEIWRDFSTRSGTTPIPRPLSQLPNFSSHNGMQQTSLEQAQLQAERDAALQQANLERIRRELREAEHQQQLRSLLQGNQNMQYQINDRLVLEMSDSHPSLHNHQSINQSNNHTLSHEPSSFAFPHHPSHQSNSYVPPSPQPLRSSTPSTVPKPPQRVIGMRKLVTKITPVSARLAVTRPIVQSTSSNSITLSHSKQSNNQSTSLINQSNNQSFNQSNNQSISLNNHVNKQASFEDSFSTPAPLSRARPAHPPLTTSGKSRIAPPAFDTPQSRTSNQTVNQLISRTNNRNQPIPIHPLLESSDRLSHHPSFQTSRNHVVSSNVIDDDDNASNASLGSHDSHHANQLIAQSVTQSVNQAQLPYHFINPSNNPSNHQLVPADDDVDVSGDEFDGEHDDDQSIKQTNNQNQFINQSINQPIDQLNDVPDVADEDESTVNITDSIGQFFDDENDGSFETDEDDVDLSESSESSESDDETDQLETETVNPPPSEQPALPTEEPDSYNVDFSCMQAEKALNSWWLEIHNSYQKRKAALEEAIKQLNNQTTNQPNNQTVDEIYAAGRVVITCKGLNENEAWGSGAILGRNVTNNQIDSSCLVTATRLYRLVGPCDIVNMRKAGWSEKTIRRLENGLCPGWKSLVLSAISRREGWSVDESDDESKDDEAEHGDTSVGEDVQHEQQEHHGQNEEQEQDISHAHQPPSDDDDLKTPRTMVRQLPHINIETVDVQQPHHEEASEDPFVTPAVDRRRSRAAAVQPITKPPNMNQNEVNDSMSDERPIMRVKRWTKVEQTVLINAAASHGLMAEHTSSDTLDAVIEQKWADVADTVGGNRSIEECKKQFDKFCKEQTRIEQRAIQNAASRTSPPSAGPSINQSIKTSLTGSAVVDSNSNKSHSIKLKLTAQTKTKDASASIKPSKSAHPSAPSGPVSADVLRSKANAALKAKAGKTSSASATSPSQESNEQDQIKRGRGRPRKDDADVVPAQTRRAQPSKPTNKPSQSTIERRAPRLLDTDANDRSHIAVSAAVDLISESSASDEEDRRVKPVQKPAKQTHKRPQQSTKRKRAKILDSDEESVDHVSATSSDSSDDEPTVTSAKKPTKKPSTNQSTNQSITSKALAKPAATKALSAKPAVKASTHSSNVSSKSRAAPDSPPSAVDRSAVAVAISRHSGRTVLKPLDFWTGERELNGMVIKGVDTHAVAQNLSTQPSRTQRANDSSSEWSAGEKRALQNAYMNVWPVTKTTFWFDVAAMLGTGRTAAECQMQHELQWKTPKRAKRKAEKKVEKESDNEEEADAQPRGKKPRTMVTKKRAVRAALQERDEQYAGDDIFDATPFKDFKQQESQIEKAAGVKPVQLMRARPAVVLSDDDTDDDMNEDVFSVDRAHADAVIQRIKKDRKPGRDRVTAPSVAPQQSVSMKRVLDTEMRGVNAAVAAREARAAAGDYDSDDDEIVEESD